jgi:hypothetical protein
MANRARTTRLLAACGVAVAMFATTAPCSAQVKVEFTPFAGAYVPTAHLVPMGTLPDVYSILSLASVRQKAGLALGSRITAWLTDRFAIDGSFGYSGSGAAQTGYIDLACPCPSGVPFCCSWAVTSNATGHTWMASARLLFVVDRHPPSTVLYILGGPAFVGHEDNPVFNPTPDYNFGAMTVRKPGAVVGIGARFKVPKTALALRAELEDYLYVARFSGYEGLAPWSSSQVQNDLLLSVGLAVRPSKAAARQR